MSVAYPESERMDSVLDRLATALPKPGAMPQRADVLTTLTFGVWGCGGHLPSLGCTCSKPHNPAGKALHRSWSGVNDQRAEKQQG